MWKHSLVRLGWNLYEGQVPLKSQSPEVLREERPTYASDIFSLGTILYKLLFGCDPFEGETDDQLLSSIKSKKFKKTPTVSPFDIEISKDAFYLLTSMLDYYP